MHRPSHGHSKTLTSSMQVAWTPVKWIPPTHMDAIQMEAALTGCAGREEPGLTGCAGMEENHLPKGGMQLPLKRCRAKQGRLFCPGGHRALPSRLNFAATLQVTKPSRVQGLCHKAPVSSTDPGTLQLFPQSKEEHGRRETPQGGLAMSQTEPCPLPSPFPELHRDNPLLCLMQISAHRSQCVQAASDDLIAEDWRRRAGFHGVVSRAETWLQFAHLMDERWQASDLGKDAVLCHGHWGTRGPVS